MERGSRNSNRPFWEAANQIPKSKQNFAADGFFEDRLDRGHIKSAAKLFRAAKRREELHRVQIATVILSKSMLFLGLRLWTKWYVQFNINVQHLDNEHGYR